LPTFLTRFAPSPTGYLHVGHAYSALCAQQAAQAAGGALLLRIEDIDRTRCRPEYEAAVLEDLAWLGVEWRDPPRRQSDHMADYAAGLSALQAQGVLYRCFRTRREILADIARAPHLGGEGEDGLVYFGAPPPAAEEAARLAAGAPFAWRLSLARCRESLGDVYQALEFPDEDEGSVQAQPEMLGDAILARKDFGASYHLASVLDDAAQGITHIIRGADLRSAAHLHRLLQALLGLPTPIYRHHRLILDDSCRRLAKRDRAATLRALRLAGADPAQLRARLLSHADSG
jgi:glutamyl-Q tRNA(Asp) synthetase